MKNTTDKNKLYSQMQSAIILTQQDPMRREIEQQIAMSGPEVEQAWLNMLCEEERMKLALLRVEVPLRLQENLLTIPDQKHHSPFQVKRWWYQAAALILIFFMSVLAWNMGQHYNLQNKLNTVVLLSSDEHLRNTELSIPTKNPRDLEQALTTQLPFKPSFPQLSPSFVLLGGQKATLGSHPVSLSRWEGPDGNYTLFQFRIEDFALKANLQKTIIHPKGLSKDKLPCEALIWTEDQLGYLLVANLENCLDQLKQMPSSSNASHSLL